MSAKPTIDAGPVTFKVLPGCRLELTFTEGHFAGTSILLALTEVQAMVLSDKLITQVGLDNNLSMEVSRHADYEAIAAKLAERIQARKGMPQ